MRRIRPLPLAFLAALLVGAPFARAGEPDETPAPRRPLLWVIERDAPVFLFGTIHIPDERVLDLLPVVRRALDACDVFNAEIPMEPAEFMKAQPLMMLPADQALDDILGEELWQKVVPLATEGGVPKTVLKRLKPWVLGMQLFMRALTPSEEAEEGEPAAAPAVPIDQWLYSHEKEAGKEVGGLETVEEQLRVFDGIPQEGQVELVRSAIAMLDEKDEDEDAEAAAAQAKAQVNRLMDLYLAGDEVELGKAIREVGELEGEGAQEFFKRLIDDRNVTMVDRLLAKMEAAPDKVLFVAVGAGHYPGPKGILALLAEKGVKVRRLEADSPLPLPETAGAGGR